MKILNNPTDHNILNYRIAEIQVDENENPKLNNEGNPMGTGRTLEWSINAGETLEFPNYVADYLKQIYGFLKILEKSPEIPVIRPEIPKQSVETVKQEELTEPAVVLDVHVQEVGKLLCKHCGQSFQKAVNLGLHFGAKHPEKLM